MRSFGVFGRGVVVVPATTPWSGPALGATRAASLQRVANRPIICHVLDALHEAGVAQVAVLAPPDVKDEVAACVDREGPGELQIRHLSEEPGQSESALATLAEFAGAERCIVHRADGLAGQPLSAFAQALSDESSDALLLVRDDARESRRLRLVPHRRLDPSDEDADDSAAPAYGVAGACLFGAGALARLRDLKCSGPVLDFATLATALTRAGERVHARVIPKWRHFAGDAQDLLDINRMALDAIRAETPVASDGNRFEGAVVIDPTAIVSSSVIIGPAIVGADALIADSYIGPHTSIGERVRLEGTELERSIVLADASVLHVGGRLVASIVGRHARIFRDFSMPRALRLQVGDRDEVALC